jgi:hypothetical protein
LFYLPVEVDLVFNRKSRGLRWVKYKEDKICQMFQGHHGIEFYLIHLLHWTIQEARRVYDLIFLPTPFHMANLDSFGGERIIRNLWFCIGYLSEHGGLSNMGNPQ